MDALQTTSYLSQLFQDHGIAWVGDIHWFRLFFGNVANTFTFEALKDNEKWEAGTHCLESAQWKPSSGYYSVRLFAVLRTA